MSLRARLILGLLALAAAGLITLALVTYVEQRSSLMQRIDQEAQTGVFYMSRRLDCEQFGCGQGPLGEGLMGSQVSFPPGTVGYRRDQNGNDIVRPLEETYQERNGTFRHFPVPSLPTSLPMNQLITLGSSSGTDYRVLAIPTGDQAGTITIIAVPLTDVYQTLHRLFIVEALVIAAVLAALAALAWWVVRLGLRPLDRIAQTAGAIAAGDLSQRVTPASEHTEVGRLGLALNAMLTQIEKAFHAREASENRLRRFLADASHELRTPLAAIRGYAELYRLGAGREPEDAAASMRRIEDEAKRMGELVENLLTLARLDQVPAAERKPVDLSKLAANAAEDAHVTAPDREIAFASPGPVTVMGDSSQLQQVIGNLVRNALVHTPAGTPVEISVGSENGSALLEVRDHGRGLPSEEPEQLFERFWRADPGRGRGAAGAGLGLSIVRAFVEAHGGRVAAANAPGGGASFTVRLPFAAPARGREPALPASAARAP